MDALLRGFAVLLLALAGGAARAQGPVVVSGQVTDAATGLPVEDASVSIADQLKYTDAGGRYMLDPVAPGSAEVQVSAKGYLALDKTKIQIAADQANHDFKLLRSATISGKISAADSGWRRAGFVVRLLREDFTDGVRRFALPSDERRAISVINDDGSFEFSGLAPGRYIISAAPQSGVHTFIERGRDGKPLPAKRAEEGYVRTFFPGTPDLAAAIPIAIAAGENRTADFRLAMSPLYRMSGELEGAAAKGATVEVESRETGQIYTGAISDGKFALDGLPPGDYRVMTAMTPIQPEPGGNRFQVAMTLLRLDTPFSITDHDVDGLVVTPPPLRGRINTAGQFRVANGGALPGGLSVQFAYPQPGGESTPVAASPDGMFWLDDAPGEYSVRPVVPAGYAVTEIRYGGGNYLFSLIPLGGGVGDQSITITVSDQPASVSGVLVDEDGKAVAAKVAFVPDPIPADFDFRAIRVAVTNDRGGFVMGDFAAGRYKAVALTGDDRRRDHDMALIGPRLGLADAFELAAGQSLRIELRP